MPHITSERPKRLVVCCDGTWQSSVTGIKNIPSNVTRLARSIAREGKDEDGKIWQQIVHYDAGIGTGEISKNEKNRQGGFGVGFVGNVIEAYNFLALNWAPGDKVYCFGFSRGAYTARAVAGLVNDIGICAPRDMQDFPDLFTLYAQHKDNDSTGFRRSRAYREWVTGVLNASQPIDSITGLPRYDKPPHTPAKECSREVEVVGVFDTVGSLGVPDTPFVTIDLALNVIGAKLGANKVGFHNVDLSPYIRNAFQALALDEHRGPFTPSLWHYPIDDAVPKPPAMEPDTALANWKKVYHDKASTQDNLSKAWTTLIDSEMYHHLKVDGVDSKMSQVWFPGHHVNIGGGNDDILNEKLSDFEQIALISFAWMVEKVSPFLQFEEDIHTKAVADRMALVVPALAEVAKAEATRERAVPQLWKAFDVAKVYKADIKRIPDSAIYGWATGPMVDSFVDGVNVLAGSIPRTPGRYTHGPRGEKYGETMEEIHPSVAYRKQKGGYAPPPLRGFERKLGKTGYEWVNGQTGLRIPEYKIAARDIFTRHVADQDKKATDNATNFLKQTDQALATLQV